MVYDIIIIGGGIGGLYSAYKLLKKNNKLNIVILEKNNYLGGRIKTFRKNINNHDYQFEEGAGRFNNNHKLLFKLLKELELDQYIIKINSDIKFFPSGNSYKNKKQFIGESPFIYIKKVINFYKKYDMLNYIKIQTYTFYEYASKILEPNELDFVIDSFGYYKQLVSMNAYNAIKLFEKGMNSYLQFYSLACGFDMIINKLKENIIKLGGKIIINQYVKNINYNLTEKIFSIYLKSNKIYKSKNCILAIPKPDLLQFNILNNSIITKKLLNSIGYKSLCRIYSIFEKKDIWFSNISKTTTNNSSRYIIPIDKENGLIMISYSDSKFANNWNKLEKINKKEVISQLKKNIYKTFHQKIIDPIFTKVCYWKVGTAFWKKNKNSKIISKKILKPFSNIPMYICGENYSETQGWIEGALETSKLVILEMNI